MGEIKSDHQKPIILYERRNTLEDLEDLKSSKPIWRILDIYKAQVEELFEITNPKLRFSPSFTEKRFQFIKEHMGDGRSLRGNWVYFPWNGYLIHTVNKDDYNLIRTNRNRDLITQKEQEKLLNACIGIVGLSVGSNIAIGLAYEGISFTMKLAEMDVLETSNLNRVRAGIQHIGTHKISVTAQRIYEVNPYSKLKLFDQGLVDKTLHNFFHKNPVPDIVFDEVDDFVMKVCIRFEARTAGIPVLMLANVGDSIIIDIERYDLDKTTPIFNGILGDIPEEILNKKSLTEEDKNRYAVQFVGVENIPKRALESVQEIGKTLVGRPQLSSTVTLSGGIATYLARKVLLNQKLPSGRTVVRLQEVFCNR